MKKLHLYAMLLFVCLIAACKKEEVNNPDIDDVTLGFSIETTDPAIVATKELFIDGEVVQDFQFVITHNDEDPNQHFVYIGVYDSKYEILKQIPIVGLSVVKKLEKNESILPTDLTWSGSNPFFLFCDFIEGATNYKYGSSDIGDQYIAFRKKNSGGGYFYGWMLINISNIGQKLEIKEYALHKIADTAIRAGEK